MGQGAWRGSRVVPGAILDPKLVGDFARRGRGGTKRGLRQQEQDSPRPPKLVETHNPGGLESEIATRAVGNCGPSRW